MIPRQNDPCPICGATTILVGQGQPWYDEDDVRHAGEPLYGWRCHTVAEIEAERARRMMAADAATRREADRVEALCVAWQAGKPVRVEIRDEWDPDSWFLLRIDQEARLTPDGLVIKTAANRDLDRFADHYYLAPADMWRVAP